ncbi:hypothetical protein AXG93_4601s1260 [Marchantia polymorpha subsp. ruderalis]|uniref:Major facilitator superfamily (MFS) profile domain-containing protein n=1 Tax=Marchantia polymorpha subsp. ruderalis TaxID=1480154 RepID=A0A176VZ58_MARPO|nr:hypothetical protein AXG93_4601s1260 [Marchantia polymorpha subsp. ruderalis]
MDVQEPMATSAAVAGAGCTESGPGNSGSIPSTRDSETPKSRQAIAGAPSSNDCTEVQIEAATTAEMKLSLYGPTGLLLPRRSILSYGTGHMLNDLTAACWFTYLLIFLTDVGLSPQQAATVMLSGQVADGIATIFVGQLIDKFGHFKIWHAGGSILVALSFSSVFGGCYACELLGTTSFSAITIGYSTFAAIFNLGWAATQVSHMSLVNCITANATSRVSLNSCRNAFSMVANLCLYAIAYVVFWMFPGTSAEGVHKQALLSFYLIDDLMMGESSKAVIPALIYICSFLTSIVLQELHWTGHRLKGVYAGGACLWIFSGAALYLLPIDFKSSIYGLAGIIGLGNALMLVTATSMQGVLVGHDLSGVAFVYGSLSFLDKLTCGIALYLIEGLNDETRSCRRNGSDLTISCSGSTIRTALGLVPSACALVAALVTVSMNLTDTDADTSVLSKPLLDESATGQDQGETSALRLNGHSSEAEGRSKARSILPFRGRRGRNYELVSGSDETDEGDIEKNKREEDQGFSIWKLLEMSMVDTAVGVRRQAKTTTTHEKEQCTFAAAADEDSVNRVKDNTW